MEKRLDWESLKEYFAASLNNSLAIAIIFFLLWRSLDSGGNPDWDHWVNWVGGRIKGELQQLLVDTFFMLYTIRLRSRWRYHLNCVDWSFVDGPRWRGDKVRGGDYSRSYVGGDRCVWGWSALRSRTLAVTDWSHPRSGGQRQHSGP